MQRRDAQTDCRPRSLPARLAPELRPAEAPLVVLRRALDQPLELLVLHEVLRERHPRQLLVTLVRGHAFVTECGQILQMTGRARFDQEARYHEVSDTMLDAQS